MTRIMNVRIVSDKSRTTALIFCILLGFFGLHRFYVGKSRSGILYFFTLGMFGLGIIIDLLLLITGQFRDKEGKLVLD